MFHRIVVLLTTGAISLGAVACGNDDPKLTAYSPQLRNTVEKQITKRISDNYSFQGLKHGRANSSCNADSTYTFTCNTTMTVEKQGGCYFLETVQRGSIQPKTDRWEWQNTNADYEQVLC